MKKMSGILLEEDDEDSMFENEVPVANIYILLDVLLCSIAENF